MDDENGITETVQVMLSYLDDPANSTPNNMLEGMVSGKSLLRAISGGELFICAKVNPPAEKKDKDTDKDAEKKEDGKRQPTE